MSINFWNSIEQNNVTVLQDTLQKEKIDKSAKDSFGLSAIQLALTKSNIDVAKILIANKFDADLKDNKGQTALHYCAFYNYIELAILLLDNGASLFIEDDFGNQPLWTAVFNDKGFGKRKEIITLFLNNGADINHKNKTGRSPLDFVQTAGYLDLINLLSQVRT